MSLESDFGNSRQLAERTTQPNRPMTAQLNLLESLLNCVQTDTACALCTVVGTRGSTPQTAGAMLLVHPTGECVFFKDKGCTIYKVRPYQCSSYPFWPHLLESRKDWDKQSEKCPGMDRGETHEFKDIIKTMLKFRDYYG